MFAAGPTIISARRGRNFHDTYGAKQGAPILWLDPAVCQFYLPTTRTSQTSWQLPPYSKANLDTSSLPPTPFQPTAGQGRGAALVKPRPFSTSSAFCLNSAPPAASKSAKACHHIRQSYMQAPMQQDMGAVHHSLTQHRPCEHC